MTANAPIDIQKEIEREVDSFLETYGGSSLFREHLIEFVHKKILKLYPPSTEGKEIKS